MTMRYSLLILAIAAFTACKKHDVDRHNYSCDYYDSVRSNIPDLVTTATKRPGSVPYNRFTNTEIQEYENKGWRVADTVKNSPDTLMIKYYKIANCRIDN